MADYGLKTWDSDGNQTLDLNDLVTRLRYTTLIASSDTNGSIVFPELAGVPCGYVTTLATPFSILAPPHAVNRVATSGKWKYHAQTIRPIPFDKSGNSKFQIFIYKTNKL